MSDHKIFCLGDSRTGTTSVHHYFGELGFRSVHFYPEAAGAADPFYEDRKKKWLNFVDFIYSSGYRAFTDYPTRSFFRELIETFPGADFILTTRRSVDTWRRSMSKYFGLTGWDLDRLTAFYIAWNEEIVWACRDLNRKFLEICIDDDPAKNASEICKFLGCPYAGELPCLNASAVA